jgi:hypothetical protein
MYIYNYVDSPISPGSIPSTNEIALWAISISKLISHTALSHKKWTRPIKCKFQWSHKVLLSIIMALTSENVSVSPKNPTLHGLPVWSFLRVTWQFVHNRILRKPVSVTPSSQLSNYTTEAGWCHGIQSALRAVRHKTCTAPCISFEQT